MKPIPLIKRILYYAVLSLISFIMMIVVAFLSLHNFRIIDFGILAFLFPQYIFGMIFLKTKWIFKLIVPFATAIISFGCIWLFVFEVDFWYNIFHSELLLCLVCCIPIVFLWEIAYQIVKFCHNHTTNQQLDKSTSNNQINK